jgi:hypothetical protein
VKESHKELITQMGLAVFGVLGIAASYSSDPTIKTWSPVVGLMSQPFWFYMTFTKRMWGALFVTFLYTGSWCFGIYQNFFK